MTVKPNCCEKFLRKSKLCKSCPFAVGLNKKKRKNKARKLRRRAA